MALSVVGTERLSKRAPSNGPNTAAGYFRAKLEQEKLIKNSSLPYSIVHATQFFEFVKGIADASTDGTTVRVAPVLIQPMAADDVAKAVGRIAMGAPVNAVVEVAGPQEFRLNELIRQGLRALNDRREVIADTRAGYYGIDVDERTLLPSKGAQMSEIRFEDWLRQPALAK